VDYRFHADVNGDSVSDKDISFTFIGTGASQTFAIRGLSAANTYLTGPCNNVVNFSAGAATGFVGSANVFCGFREDPFFFDLTGFQQFLAGSYNFQGGAAGLRDVGGTAANTFNGQNVAAIVIEMDEATLQAGANPVFKAWASTRR
jgi:hypothetical protein